GQNNNNNNADGATLATALRELAAANERMNQAMVDMHRNLTPNSNAGSAKGTRNYVPRSKEVGEFEPKSKPDHFAAYNIITRVTNACRLFDEQNIMGMILNSFTNDIGQSWLASLSPEDLRTLTSSLNDFQTIMKRDWYLPKGTLKLMA